MSGKRNWLKKALAILCFVPAFLVVSVGIGLILREASPCDNFVWIVVVGLWVVYGSLWLGIWMWEGAFHPPHDWDKEEKA